MSTAVQLLPVSLQTTGTGRLVLITWYGPVPDCRPILGVNTAVELQHLLTVLYSANMVTFNREKDKIQNSVCNISVHCV